MNAARITLSALEASPLLAEDLFTAATSDGHGLPVGRVEDPLEEAIRRVGWWLVGKFGAVYLVRSLAYLRTCYLVKADREGRDAWAVPVLIDDDRGDAVDVEDPLFPPGAVWCSPASLGLLAELGTDPVELLARHYRGDWGEVDEWEAEYNALEMKGRGELGKFSVSSRYILRRHFPLDPDRLPERCVVYVITEENVPAAITRRTRLLLPHEWQSVSRHPPLFAQ
jgi:hypothetical protein